MSERNGCKRGAVMGSEVRQERGRPAGRNEQLPSGLHGKIGNPLVEKLRTVLPSLERQRNVTDYGS